MVQRASARTWRHRDEAAPGLRHSAADRAVHISAIAVGAPACSAGSPSDVPTTVCQVEDVGDNVPSDVTDVKNTCLCRNSSFGGDPGDGQAVDDCTTANTAAREGASPASCCWGVDDNGDEECACNALHFWTFTDSGGGCLAAYYNGDPGDVWDAYDTYTPATTCSAPPGGHCCAPLNGGGNCVCSMTACSPYGIVEVYDCSLDELPPEQACASPDSFGHYTDSCLQVLANGPSSSRLGRRIHLRGWRRERLLLLLVWCQQLVRSVQTLGSIRRVLQQQRLRIRERLWVMVNKPSKTAEDCEVALAACQ